MSTTAQRNSERNAVLIKSGDLISQEEQFIKEYATYFKLPTNLNRSEVLERICQLHPGSTPSIPILPHLTFERVNGGKIRFTGRVFADETPATRPAPAVAANRRLVRQSNLLQAIIEAEQRVAPECERDPSSREDTPSPATPVDVAPPQQTSAGKETLEDPFNMEHNVDIVLRFPTPVDEFDPPPPRRAHRSGSPDSAASSLLDIPPKRRMKFVYPPVPRTPTDPEKALPGVPRAFSPGDTWVEKMYMDLTRGRRDVKNDLDEVKREVRDATEEVLKAQLEYRTEMQNTQDFLDYLKQFASEEWTDEILDYAERLAEQGSSDLENFDEADDQSGGEGRGVDDDGDEASDDDSDRDDDDDDRRGTRDDGEADERSDDRHARVESDEGSNDSEGDPSPVQDPARKPSHINKVFFPPCTQAVALEEVTRLPSRSSVEDSPSSRPSRTGTDDAGTRSPAGFTLNLKRDRDDDDSDDSRDTGELSPSSKRAKSSHDAPSNRRNEPAPHAALSDQATHSPSRKRSRDDEDDNQSSELEVELSIRRSASEGSSDSLDDLQGSRKKARSDDRAHEPHSPSRANSTPSPSFSPRARPPNDPPVGGSDSSSSGSGDDEEHVENGWPAGLFGSRGVYDGASEDDEDADSIDGSAPSPGWNSVGTHSPPPGGPRFSYPPGRNPSESQLIAGASNPSRTTRPLRRDTERLRETGDGGVEAYNYEEDPHWRRGTRLQRLAVQAHQAHPSYGAALSPEMDFEGLRLPTGWGVEFASEEG